MIGLHRIGAVATLALAVQSAAPNLASAQYTQTSIQYDAWNLATLSTCDVGKNAVVYVPDGEPNETYPVHIFLTGTNADYNEQPALDLLEGSVAKGFVSATVDYDNHSWQLLLKHSCTSMNARGRCIFEGPSSALGKICALPQADCSKGVVVSGVSQGGILAALAKNHDERVRAALAFSIGDYHKLNWLLTWDLKSCLDDGTSRALASSRLRIVNGSSDEVFGENEAGVRAQLARITGLTCSEQDCLCTGSPSDPAGCTDANGSGYYIVRPADLGGQPAEHCFVKQGNACYGDTFNWNFECSEEPWAARADYEWLVSFAETNDYTDDLPPNERCEASPQ